MTCNATLDTYTVTDEVMDDSGGCDAFVILRDGATVQRQGDRLVRVTVHTLTCGLPSDHINRHRDLRYEPYPHDGGGWHDDWPGATPHTDPLVSEVAERHDVSPPVSDLRHTDDPDPTIRDEALAALAKREEAAAERRAELLREREEREAKEHAARVKRCLPVITETLGDGWAPVDSGDSGDECWVTFEPSDDSVDLTLVVHSNGKIAVAEKRWSRGREPAYGKRIESFADLGQVIKDQQQSRHDRRNREASDV